MGCDFLQSIELWIGLIWALLKPVSWALGWLAERTESKWDNRVAQFFARLLSYFGWLVGLFGIGNVPGSVKHKPTFKLRK